MKFKLTFKVNVFNNDNKHLGSFGRDCGDTFLSLNEITSQLNEIINYIKDFIHN